MILPTKLRKLFTAVSRNSRYLALSGFLMILVSNCAKGPMVIRNGVEMPVNQAAKIDYDDAEILLQKKHYNEAFKKYQTIVSEMPMSEYADNALLRSSQIQRLRKKLPEAEQLLESLVTRYPTGDATNEGKEELAKLRYARRDYRGAAELFATIDVTKVPLARIGTLEEAARGSFDKTNVPKWKLRFLISFYDATSTQRPNVALQNEIVELLDQSATQDDLEQMLAIRKTFFPAGHACFKLAKLAYHAGDRAAARKWISMYLNQFRDLEYTREAVELSAALEQSTDVDSNAIGILAPLSGNNRFYANQMLRGVAIAMNLFSPAAGTSAARFYIEDSGDDPEKAVSALEKLVNERKVIAVIGPLFAKQSQMAALAASRYELPMVSLSAAEGITELGDTIFRNGLTKSSQAASLAAVAHDTLGIRRVALLYPDNNYGTEFMSLFWEEFVKRGGEIRGAESYDPEANDFGPPLKKIVGLDPPGLRPDNSPNLVDFEALFVPDNAEKATQIAPALSYYDIRGVVLLGTNLWNSPEILKGGDKGAYFQGSVFLDSFYKGKKDPAVSKFMERFYSLYGEEPGVFEAQAYDTVSLVLSVLQSQHQSSRSAFSAALAAVQKFPGVSGEISFNTKRDAEKKLTVLTVDDGRIIELQ